MSHVSVVLKIQAVLNITLLSNDELLLISVYVLAHAWLHVWVLA